MRLTNKNVCNFNFPWPYRVTLQCLLAVTWLLHWYISWSFVSFYHQHHHVPEGLVVFPVPWSSRWSWSLRLFLSRPMFLRLFGLYFSACFGCLFVSILCTCVNHFFWYYFISFTMFCAPIFCLILWFFSLSNFVIPSKCLKISSVLLLNVVPFFSSVPKLHFQNSMLL